MGLINKSTEPYELLLASGLGTWGIMHINREESSLIQTLAWTLIGIFLATMSAIFPAEED